MAAYHMPKGYRIGPKRKRKETETGSGRVWQRAICLRSRVGSQREKEAETGSTRIWQLAIYQGNRIGPKRKREKGMEKGMTGSRRM